ncbi:hypothetical protein M407DRAFT_7733 [Tulasnella calospora MUT 4182]|uniref:Uncharacterized protein n=1 Tax=Tulasnella calospora MUT 4182 TaxID=1051891 RepID=A0A0C3QK39_9AGAM|nr:hypothetical protein M407DRAFT_7733 [Tulasnella calospora MUT 4182]
MSTEHLNENQKRVYDVVQFFEKMGGSAGYLASVKAPKASTAFSLTEIPTGNYPSGPITVEFISVGPLYVVSMVFTADGNTYSGKGLFEPPSGVTPQGWTGTYLGLSSSFDDLLGADPKPCPWTVAQGQLVGTVQPPNQPKEAIMHIFGGPTDSPLNGVTLQTVWTKA